jgi:glycosyltransferase involved in cell wall biosynthesis
LPEILGEAAVYFAPDDIEAMVAIMENILRDAALRSRLIAQGKEQVKKYSWPEMAAATVRVYQTALLK